MWKPECQKPRFRSMDQNQKRRRSRATITSIRRLTLFGFLPRRRIHAVRIPNKAITSIAFDMDSGCHFCNFRREILRFLRLTAASAKGIGMGVSGAA